MIKMNYINTDNCSLIIDGIGRRAYVNSLAGRAALAADLKGKDDALLAQVFAAWGDEPTIDDELVPTFEELKAAKYDEIAASRYAAETGGCTVNGMTIATDRGSQALLTAAVVMARMDPEFKTRWKCADGRFVSLDAMQLRAIGDAVTAHVEACFAREAELVELIDAAQTPEDLAAIKWSL